MKSLVASLRRSKSDSKAIQGDETKNDEDQPGVIDEVLPKSMFRVRLEDGRSVRAAITTSARHGIVRLIEGDKVLVRVYPSDPTRAQITKKR
jgi:translation initiation factor IF-1